MSAQIINDMIKDEYGIVLLTCPDCGKAFSSYDSNLRRVYNETQYEDIRECPACGVELEENMFPDLFT